MNLNYSFESKSDSKHKVFLSYYHKDDQYYRDRFEILFGHLFLNKSVKPGDINTENSDDYIKRLIQQNYIEDSSVIVVLVGPKTFGRKHVDWEISAALNRKIGGYSGLLGLCLQSHPDFNRSNYSADIVPPRLVDNLKTGYAKFINWTEEEGKIKNYIEEAFKARVDKSDMIDNSRVQFQNNRCE